MRSKLLLLLLLLSASSGAYAQQLQTVRNYHGFSDKLAEVYTVKQGTGIKQGNYKSYTSNGYPVLDCNFSDNVLHGVYKKYYGEYLSRQLQLSGNYNKGEMHGEWREWAKKDGGDFYLRRVTTYHNGEERGQKLYTWDGKLVQDINYNGRFFDADNSRFKNATGSSRVKREGTTKNGELDGELTDTFEDGSVYKSTWSNGKQQGKGTTYYANGQIASEVEYLSVQRGSSWESKRVGKLTQWYENGVIKEITEYSNDGKETIMSQKIYTDKDALEKETILDQSKNLVYVTVYDPKTGAKSYTVEHKPGSTATDYIRRIEYYPSGKMKSERFKNSVNGVWSKTYHEDGTLAGSSNSDGSISEYYTNGKLKKKIFKPTTTNANTKQFEEYDESGSKTAEEIMDKDNNILETTYYTDGVKIAYINEKTGITVSYDPAGHIDMITDANNNYFYYDASGNVIGKGRDSEQRTERGLSMEDYVGFYSNGQIKEKGVRHRNGKVGVWYLYSTSSKLSIWENGATRKPTKEETANHSQYLQDLINAKAPTKSSTAPATNQQQGKTEQGGLSEEEKFFRGLR